MKKFVRGPVKKGRDRKSGRSRSEGSSFKRRDSSDRFSRDRPSRGREGGSRDRERSSRDRSERTEVICDKCKAKCEVPFKPTSDKPVYCSDCFKSDSRPDSRGRRDNSSKGLEQINEKLDLIMKALKI